MRETQKMKQEGIHIGDAPRAHIQNQNAVLRGFKQPPVAQFGGAERLLRPSPVVSQIFVLSLGFVFNFIAVLLHYEYSVQSIRSLAY